MQSTILKDNSLPSLIAKRITQQIITGELKPSEKLIEYTYAEAYGISRAPVREAFYLLTIEGLVERIPRKGVVVKGYTSSEIYDLLEIRIMLETLAMKRISENGIDDHLLAQMEIFLQDMQNEKDIKSYTQLNHKFHLCIIKMSQSDVIQNMYSRLEMQLLTIQNMSFAREGNIDKSIREHKILVGLLKENQIDIAADMLSKHNRDVIDSIHKRMQEDHLTLGSN
jgi:DNA-binding GntR family transcriptional regulator